METTLTLEANELCALIEVLYDGLLNRIKWTVRRKERQTPSGWHTLDWETAQASIDMLAGAYTKAYMALKALSNEVEVDTEFEKTFTPRPQLWDLLNQITLAKEWDQVPTHEIHDNCDVCYQLAQV